MMRRSDRFILLLGVLALLVAGLPLHASLEARASEPVHEERAALVRELGLTDLCLFVLGPISNMGNIASNLNSLPVCDVDVLDKGVEIQKGLEYRFLTRRVHGFDLFSNLG